jgi:hypothetical protein
MITVYLILSGEKRLYGTRKVFNFLKGYEKKDEAGNTVNEVLYKLAHYARCGFRVDNETIKPEGDGVFRIRVHNVDRIIGFYDENNFIAITFITNKKKQKLSRSQRQVIKDVAKIKRDKNWTTGEDNENE